MTYGKIKIEKNGGKEKMKTVKWMTTFMVASVFTMLSCSNSAGGGD